MRRHQRPAERKYKRSEVKEVVSERIRRSTLTPDELEEALKWAMQQKWVRHCSELRAKGIDPNWIGSQEVDPICCLNCGEQIPWVVIKGWRD